MNNKIALSFIDTVTALENLTGNQYKTISKADYELFCKEFVFTKLKGVGFGQAFCERFGFNGLFLKNLSDETAKEHIELLGYIK